jgi:hypothetical protein
MVQPQAELVRNDRYNLRELQRMMRRLGIHLPVLAAILFAESIGRASGIECDTFENLGDRDSFGRTVILQQKSCAGIADTDMRSVIVLFPSGRRSMVFQYEPAFSFPGYRDKATPTVKWLSAGVLDIAIGAVAFVHVQRQHAGDVTIRYEIGEVLIKR